MTQDYDIDPENPFSSYGPMLSQPYDLIDYFGLELGCDLKDAAEAPSGMGLAAALWSMDSVRSVNTPPLGFHLFSICLSGHGSLKQSHLNQTVSLGSEVCFFTPKGARLEIAQNGSAEMLHIMLDEPLIQMAASGAAAGPLSSIVLDPTVGWNGVMDPGMFATSLVVLAELVSGRLDTGEAAAWLAKGLSQQITRRLITTGQRVDDTGRMLTNADMDRVFAYVHSNLIRPLTVSEIAKQNDVCPRLMEAAFHMRLGIGPAAYVDRARALRAWMLLNVLEYTAQTVSEKCGYQSVHQMFENADRVASQAETQPNVLH